MPLDKKLERKFRRSYGFDLLDVSSSDCFLGDIIEWDGVIRKKMDMENISLVHYLKIEKPKKDELVSRLSQIELKKAGMQQITIDSSFDIKAGVDIPNYAMSVGLELGFENFVNFRIEDIKMRILSGELKVELMHLITTAKETDKKYYRKTLRKLFFIDKLLYAGVISFELKSAAQGKLEVALSKAKVVDPNISIKANGDATVTYPGSFEVPFAADIEPFKDFLD